VTALRDLLALDPFRLKHVGDLLAHELAKLFAR
jgi:hypothetical protein